MKKLSKLTSLLLCIALVFSCTAVFAEDAAEDSAEEFVIDGELAKAAANAMAMFAINTYKFGADETDLYKQALMEVLDKHPEILDDALNGMYNSMDQHTAYFNPDDFLAFVESVSGEFCGIGVTIMAFDEGLMITEVHKGSSAEAAGLKQGDVIISADGIDIRGMELEIAKNYIVGPEGTAVNIGIARDGEVAYYDLVRSKITVVPGFYQILEDNIGYIELSSFDEHSEEFMAEALEALKDTKSIIIDLRYNPGGALTSLQKIAELTLPKGPVIHLEYKFEIDNVTINNEVDGNKNKFVVLVNEYTASAAEAFSAAVQDYGVGVVVGTRTYGKGTMQTVGALYTGGGYKITVAEYLSPNKTKINDIGVVPDYPAEPKIVEFRDDYFAPVTFDRVMRVGDTGEDVLALEQRLNLMGYSVGVPDKVYGDNTFYAVMSYQEAMGLFPYGVADITTQLSIQNFLQTEDIVLDKAFDRALEIAKDIDTYMAEVKADK